MLKKNVVLALSIFLKCIFNGAPDINSSFDSHYTIDLQKDISSIGETNEIYAKNALPIAFSYNIESSMTTSLMHGLTTGNQLKVIIIEQSLLKNKKAIYKKLGDQQIQFYFAFTIKANNITWKMYNVFTQKFITGKSYQLEKESTIDITRTILIDIWESIFGEGTTPFHSFLSFLNTEREANNQYSKIVFIHPLIFGFEKIILKTTNDILDLAKLPTTPLESILFSIRLNAKVQIAKLTPQGEIISIINNNCMAISPSVNNDGLFYICSGQLNYFYFNKILKKFVTEVLDANTDYASVYAHEKEKKLLIARNRKIYEVSYQTDQYTNKIIDLKGIQVSSNESIMGNGSYHNSEKKIITSEKINGIYQIVIFEDNKKMILTTTEYHKQDPVISPCGTYIAYIAQLKNGERYVETLNIFTGIVNQVTKEPGEYRFPVWIKR